MDLTLTTSATMVREQLLLAIALQADDPTPLPGVPVEREAIRAMMAERLRLRRERAAAAKARQPLLGPEAFWDPPPPGQFRLPVIVEAFACETCTEREVAGPNRGRVQHHLRQLGRPEWERVLNGVCRSPCLLLEKQLDRESPCRLCPFKATCRTPCFVLDRCLPKADPLYFDEIPTEPFVISSKTKGAQVEELDLSRWRWADIADDLRNVLKNGIRDCLTERQQIAINMQLEGLSGVQIARELGVTKVTVHWYLVRARRRLKEYLLKSRVARRRLKKGLERRYPSSDDE